MGQVKELMKQIMELKVTSKSFQRQARKCEKCMKSEKLKQKKAIEKGNMEAARIYAENVNRKRKEQIYYLGLSSKLDAVVARFDAQVQMIMISKSLGSIVKSLQSTGNSQKMPKTMGQFEKRVVNMKSLAREGEVNSLMQQAEYEALVGLPQSAGHTVANVTAEEDDLVTRFANLKAPC